MANETSNVPDFGNWVSKRLIYTFVLLGLVFSGLGFLFWPSFGAAALCLLVGLYFAYARFLFSPKGRSVQDKVWDLVVSSLDWDGKGQALDIGCGNGALTIKVATHFQEARVTGIDYWGGRWEYSQNKCEDNAKAAGVGGRTFFQKASASKLPFEDEYFDAAVSNLCFHEVADAKDKREVIREALRVVKKGGKFAFQDLFLLKQVYGEKDELVKTIRSWGVAKVEFVETRNLPFIPQALKLPFMVGRMGLIKGEK